MKIDWLNEEMTRARVTRGFWWWRRWAVVTMLNPLERWEYEPNGAIVRLDVLTLLNTVRGDVAVARQATKRRMRKLCDDVLAHGTRTWRRS